MSLGDYVGLPFADHGRDRAGLDCWGLLRLVYAERFGLVLPSYGDGYNTVEDGEALAGLIAGHLGPWREVDASAARLGDGVLMSLGGQPRHVGLWAGRGMVLHIERGTGSLMEPAQSPRLRRRILGIFRHERLS
ncbi:hypothetical protein NS365_04535 [Aureimonas ureilytica]|uniref:NlpC/P60 domain-containing protein n=1 Tax=Aureimonas ureilytica TaxID=401562 RepID=A0A175RWS0_9HYPH|nr:NlpC/P60 family protein [Aureimonas ureilytica]KTR07329.1 hypothetical protein NS365_04535 [Aureimonas ureilytica]